MVRRTICVYFRLFWRDPDFLQKLMASLLPTVQAGEKNKKRQTAEKRAAEALLNRLNTDRIEELENPEEELVIDADSAFQNRKNCNTWILI